jgi:prolyl-tRNA editing enzyme YbaK/EbsC (Cys-tRNA(Pro) deacylase)
MKPSIRRVYDALVAQGFEPRIAEFPESTRTAAEAAVAVGTTVERIVKSLVFAAGEQTVVVLVSGLNRVDTVRLADLVGHPITRADAARVRDETGFAIGGVPPLGYSRALPVYVDEDLLGYDEVWAASGTPNSVFPIPPGDLVRVSGGQVVDIKERSS